MLGDTEADAREKAAVIRRQQVSGPTAILFLEQVWNRDLSDLDPDGPLPSFDPDLSERGHRSRAGPTPSPTRPGPPRSGGSWPRPSASPSAS